MLLESRFSLKGETAVFVKKRIMRQKVFPHRTVGGGRPDKNRPTKNLFGTCKPI